MSKTKSVAAGAPELRKRERSILRRFGPGKWRIDALSFSSSSSIMPSALESDFEVATLERKFSPAVLRRARRMRLKKTLRLNPKLARTAGLGLLSISLYALLYANEQEVLRASVSHSWSFLVPPAIALVFSLVHGSFTGAFWDALGLKPNTVRK